MGDVERRAHGVGELLNQRLCHRDDEGFLAVETVVHHPQRHSGVLRNCPDGDRADATAFGEFQCRFDELGSTLVRR